MMIFTFFSQLMQLDFPGRDGLHRVVQIQGLQSNDSPGMCLVL